MFKAVARTVRPVVSIDEVLKKKRTKALKQQRCEQHPVSRKHE
jgi:hypothetical protein